MLPVKRIPLLVIFFLTIYDFGYSQVPALQDPSNSSGHALFFKLYGGYGIRTPGSNIITASTSLVGGGANSSFTSSKVGLGAGLHFGGGIGLILNDFLNVGIDAEYLKGEDLSISATFANSPYYSTFSQLVTHSALSIVPNITFKAFSKPGYYFYTRIGILVNVNTKIQNTIKDSTYNASLGNTYVYLQDISEKFSYNVNFGAQLAVGVQFSISEILRGFGEVVGNYLPASPSSSISIINKRNFINGGESSNSTFVYNDTYANSGSNNFQSSTSGSTTTTSETLPKITHSINYVGINIGLVIRL